MASQPKYDLPTSIAPRRVVLTVVPAPTPAAGEPEPLTWGLHPRVFKLMAFSLFGYLAMLAFGFGGGAGMPLVVAICAVTFAAYLGLPLALVRAQPGRTGAPQR